MERSKRREMHKNVWLLTACQMLAMSAGSMVVFLGPIIGSEIAPDTKLATLPAASLILGTAFSTIPASLIAKRIGRRNTYLLTNGYTILIILLTAVSIHLGNFWLFCLSFILLGFTIAVTQQYRFSAMESVAPERKPIAASTVLLGGIAAAFLGPEIALWGQHLFSVTYVGSFVLLATIFSVGFAFLTPFSNPDTTNVTDSGEERPLVSIVKQSKFWAAVLSAAIGYAIMSFIMTATPISMHHIHGHSFEDTKWVIQSHVVAMFLPSLFSGWLISRLGIAKTMIAGLVIYLGFIVAALTGHSFLNYWISLVLLGVGWNFLFVGGTSLLPETYTRGEKHKVQALNDFIVFGTQSFAALSAGWFVHTLGWEAMQWYTIPLILIQLVAIGVWKMKQNKSLKSDT